MTANAATDTLIRMIARHPRQALARCNGDEYELFLRAIARARRPPRKSNHASELRRKSDGMLIASGTGELRAGLLLLRLRPRANVGDEVYLALRDLRPALVGMAARIRVEIEGGGRRIATPVDVRWPLRSRQRVARAHRYAAAKCMRHPAVAIPRDYGEQHRLSRQLEPRRLTFADLDFSARETWLIAAAARAWWALRTAAAADGVSLQLVSGFRSARYQTRIFQRKLERGQTLEQILRVNAAPGYSEHHSGRAIDVTAPGYPPAEEVFETSSAFRWLLANADRFGYTLSYPRENPHGIAYEPWHWYYAKP